MAVNRPKGKDGKQEADFINCVAFGKRAEVISQYVFKGHQFSICGRLQINKYVDKQGENRWSTDILVEDFDFLQNKQDSQPAASKGRDTETYDYQSQDNEMTQVDDGDIPF